MKTTVILKLIRHLQSQNLEDQSLLPQSSIQNSLSSKAKLIKEKVKNAKHPFEHMGVYHHTSQKSMITKNHW